MTAAAAITVMKMVMKNSFLKILQKARVLPMVGIGLPFLLSALTATFLQASTNTAIIAVLLIAGVIVLAGLTAALFLSAQKRSQAIGVGIPIILALLASAAAFSMVYVKTSEQLRVLSLVKSDDNSNADIFKSRQYTVSGLVTDTFINDRGTYGYKITVDRVSDSESIPKFKTILYSRADVGVEPYTYINAEVLLNPLQSTSGFDIKAYYKQDEIYLTGFIDGSVKIIESRQNHAGYLFVLLNHTLKERLDEYFSNDTSSFLKAILLGDRSYLSDSFTHKLKLTGVMHITAISGLHTAILAGALMWLLNRLKFILTVEIRSIITISVIWIFVALTGFNLSTVRAGIMLTILFSARLFGRKSVVLNSLFLAGIIIVAENPFAVLDIGFLMSFLATLGIILLYGRLRQLILSKIAVHNPLMDFLVKSTAVTLSSTLFLMPVYMVYFNGFSLISILTNIAAVPLGTVILVLGIVFLCVSLTPLDIVLQLLSIAINLFCNTFSLVCSVASRIPFAFVGIDKSDLPIKLLLLASIIILFIIYKRERQAIRTSALFTANVVLAALIISLFVRSGNVQLATITSYEGQAVVLSYKQSASVIIVNSDVHISKQLVDYLDSLNINTIDDYILLEPNTQTVADIKYLNEFKHINNYILDSSNQINLFLHRYYSDNVSIHSISQLNETRIFAGIDTTIAYDSSGSAIQLDIKGNRICIAPDADALSRFTEKSDIILLADKKFTISGEENAHHSEIFDARCVIIISECEKNLKNTSNTDFIDASANTVRINIRQDGEYQIIRQ